MNGIERPCIYIQLLVVPMRSHGRAQKIILFGGQDQKIIILFGGQAADYFVVVELVAWI